METYTESQEVDFYGKTNRGEFSYFIFFMWFLTWLAIMIISRHTIDDILYIVNGNLDPSHFVGMGLVILLMGLDTFIFYVGAVFRWEYKNGGKNAVNDFWKKFKKGKIPRLVGLSVVDKDGRKYMKFEFYRGIFHIDVYVLVDWDELMEYKEEWANVWRSTFKKKIDDKNYEIEIKGKKKVLSSDKVRTFEFLDKIFNEKREDIIKYLAILSAYAEGKITERDLAYACQRFKYGGKL